MIVRYRKRTVGEHPADYGLRPGDDVVVCTMIMNSDADLLLGLKLRDRFVYAAPLELFTVVDDRISRHWVFSFEAGKLAGRRNMWAYWGYPEFVHNDEHREALLDDEPEALRIFNSFAERMMLEFALPNVALKARRIETDWIMCANCADAWQSPPGLDEMVRCPTCTQTQLRPDGD